MGFKIYTKKGDKGETSLFGGKRLSKHHIRIEAYGTIDELNSFVGLVRDFCPDEQSMEILQQVQDRLFSVGSNLAMDPDKDVSPPDLKDEDIALLEQEMDRMDESLPELKHFILPGGHPVVSYCHLARTVCRRAERRVVALNEQEHVEGIIINYLNRLSDYFFMLGRYLGAKENVPEIKWMPRKS